MQLKTGQFVELNEDFYFGSYLIYKPIKDGLEPSLTNEFEISDNLPKIPYKLWCSLISLFEDYSLQQLEVHSRVLYNEKTEQWKVIIPKQSVTMGDVNYQYNDSIDLITGEKYNYPIGLSDWDCIWQIHSHNTMTLKHPSVIDDIDELKTVGGYGVISAITKGVYTVCFSIVAFDGVQKKRYIISDEQVGKIVNNLGIYDTYLIDRNNYTKEVHEYIEKYVYILPKTNAKIETNNFYTTSISVWNVDDELAELIRYFGLREIKKSLEKHETNNKIS